MLRHDGDKDLWLGFVRCSDGGAYVIGGPTGSHMTGHGENWKTKYTELLAAGWLTGGIPRIPPELTHTDMLILETILKER